MVIEGKGVIKNNTQVLKNHKTAWDKSYYKIITLSVRPLRNTIFFPDLYCLYSELLDCNQTLEVRISQTRWWTQDKPCRSQLQLEIGRITSREYRVATTPIFIFLHFFFLIVGFIAQFPTAISPLFLLSSVASNQSTDNGGKSLCKEQFRLGRGINKQINE